ncbi:Histone H1 gonadal [Taenia crassiceps]|uniref:Histone H1 gonadal n=1 Tax=Taenia crassiceps TaxID=6207 RepID=A0ABR4QCX8_9CEST
MSASASKVKKVKVAASHPPVLEMVKDAIASSKDRKGASLAVIKKYVASHYKVDIKRIAPHLRRAIVHGISNGALVRVANKGTGASGSFKLANKVAEGKVPKTAKAKKGKPRKVSLKSVPTGTASKKTSVPKAKVPSPKVGKVEKGAAGVKAKKAAPKSATKVAKAKAQRVAGPRQKTVAKTVKSITPKAKKQAPKRPLSSLVTNWTPIHLQFSRSNEVTGEKHIHHQSKWF